jgi:hypothetical protein
MDARVEPAHDGLGVENRFRYRSVTVVAMTGLAAPAFFFGMLTLAPKSNDPAALI